MPKIMIVDDEEGVRESLKLILSDYYELIVVSDGTKCVEALKNAPDVDLVLLDIKMPKTSGIEVLKGIREIAPKLNVMIVTGYRSVDAATEAVRLGATGYIVKPFRSDELLATVRKNLAVKAPSGEVKKS